MEIARVRWNGKRRFIGADEAGHTVVMDAKVENKGEGTGIRPVELVLQGLGGCSGMDVISVLEKKRQDVRGLEVIVTGTPREDYPRIYTQISLEYVVTGFGVKPEAVARAVELSEEKYCSVMGMLVEDVHVTTTFRIVEARDAGVAELAQSKDEN